MCRAVELSHIRDVEGDCTKAKPETVDAHVVAAAVTKSVVDFILVDSEVFFLQYKIC